MDFVMILYIISVIIEFFIFPINIVVVFLKNRNLKGYFRCDAVSRDRYGNNNYRATWNLFLIKTFCYKFGNEKETISGVLGKNQILSETIILKRFYREIKVLNKTIIIRIENNRYSNFTGLGNFLSNVLDTIEKDHCKESIINF